MGILYSSLSMAVGAQDGGCVTSGLEQAGWLSWGTSDPCGPVLRAHSVWEWGRLFSFCPRSSPQSEVCRQVYLLLDQQVQLEEPTSFRGWFFLQESIFSSGFYLLHSVGTAVPHKTSEEVPVAVLEMCLPTLCTVYITVKAFLVTSTSFAVRAIVWYFPYPVLKLLMQGIFKLFGDACIPWHLFCSIQCDLTDCRFLPRVSLRSHWVHWSYLGKKCLQGCVYSRSGHYLMDLCLRWAVLLAASLWCFFSFFLF